MVLIILGAGRAEGTKRKIPSLRTGQILKILSCIEILDRYYEYNIMVIEFTFVCSCGSALSKIITHFINIATAGICATS